MLIWDDLLAQATGITREEARGRALSALFPDIEERGLLARLERVLAEGVIEVLAPAFHRYLIPCAPLAPSKYFKRMQQRVTISPLREEEHIRGLLIAIEDVTARLERERELGERLSSPDEATRLSAAQALSEAEAIDPAPHLIGALGDESWRVRREVVGGLSKRGHPEMMAALVRVLRKEHRNFSILSSILQLLLFSGEETLEPLIELLGDPDPDLRLQAALALGEQRDARASGTLIAALEDEDLNVRYHAIEALGKLRATGAVDALLSIAESRDFFLAFPALDALIQINDSRIAPDLVPLLTDEVLRAPAAEALGHLGDEDAVAPLSALLNQPGSPVEVIAGALATIHDRYEKLYGEGEHIAALARREIDATGAQNLIDGLEMVSAEALPGYALVMGWLDGEAVERALTRLLGHPSARRGVVEALVRYGPRVVELLIEQLEAEDLETRKAAVIALGRIGDRRATQALVRALQCDEELTVVAAGALAKLGDRSAFEALLGFIGHENAAVRQAVISALNSLGHPEMPARLRPLLSHSDVRVRESAVKIAGYFGYPECVDLLLERCRDEDERVRRAAIEHLPYIEDDRVIPALTAALERESPRVRAVAAHALAQIESESALSHLLPALDDPDSWVRYFAARSIGRHGYGEALEPLARLARTDPASQVRIAAIEALGEIGDERAVAILAPLSEAKDRDMARAALSALGHIGHPMALQPLLSALRSPDAEQRIDALRAVAERGGPDAASTLEWAAAADGEDRVVRAAIEGLERLAARIEPDAGEAIDALVELTAGEGMRREAAIAALAHMRAEWIERVARGLGHARAEVRRSVVEALGRMKDARASRRITAALEDADATVRLSAATALAYLGSHSAEQKLALLARQDPDPAVRRAAYRALRR